MELYCSLILEFGIARTGQVGDYEVRASVFTESPLGYHPCNVELLTVYRDPVSGQCLTGSLTGAVAS